MTQKQELALLFNRRPNEWIPLPDILSLGIAQYNSRIKDLRQDGFTIVNRVEWVDNQKHSWFMYIPPKEEVTYKKEGKQLAFA